jgi:hypothetical protein
MIAPQTIRLPFLLGSRGGQKDGNIIIDYLILISILV